MKELSAAEIDLYSRQLILSDWSANQQQLIADLNLILPTSLPTATCYLAAAGFGNIFLFDDSENQLSKEPSNADQPKWPNLELKSHLQGLNPHIRVKLLTSAAEIPKFNCFVFPGFNSSSPDSKVLMEHDLYLYLQKLDTTNNALVKFYIRELDQKSFSLQAELHGCINSKTVQFELAINFHPQIPWQLLSGILSANLILKWAKYYCANR